MDDTRDFPSDADLVRHFLATVEDYEQLAAAMPISDTISVMGHKDDDVLRWRVVLHAVILRKFFGDKRVNLKKVIRAAHACESGEPLPAGTWAEIEKGFVVQPSGVLHHFENDEKVYTDEELFEAQLNGRYLHGDYGKWQTSELAGRRTDTVFLGVTLERAHKVRQLAEILKRASAAGQLAY